MKNKTNSIQNSYVLPEDHSSSGSGTAFQIEFPTLADTVCKATRTCSCSSSKSCFLKQNIQALLLCPSTLICIPPSNSLDSYPAAGIAESRSWSIPSMCLSITKPLLALVLHSPNPPQVLTLYFEKYWDPCPYGMCHLGSGQWWT